MFGYANEKFVVLKIFNNKYQAKLKRPRDETWPY